MRLTTAPRPVATIRVCVDCMLAREGDGPAETPDREPWSLLLETDVTMGTEGDDFSASPCEACGTCLAGERFAYTVWEPRQH